MTSRLPRTLLALGVAMTVTACGGNVGPSGAPASVDQTAPPTSSLAPAPSASLNSPAPSAAQTPTPDGSRQLVIVVHNVTKTPVDLFVGEDGSPTGQEVGTAVPSTIPIMSGREVVFTVPLGQRWAIYVNADRDGDGLISARDVPPDASGALPFTIWVDEGVEPIVVGPGGERLFDG